MANEHQLEEMEGKEEDLEYRKLKQPIQSNSVQLIIIIKDSDFSWFSQIKNIHFHQGCFCLLRC